MAKHPPSPRRSAGYLLEVPLLLMAIGLVLALLLPNLPPLGQKVLLGLAALPLLLGLYYMIVTPGWTPGGSGLRPPWGLAWFSLVALLIVALVVAFLAN